MALEDFTTYTESDPGSDITVDTNIITWNDLNRTTAAGGLVYKDKGVDYFDGNFTHRIKFTTPSADQAADGAWVYFWVLTNAIDYPGNIDTANGDFQGLYWLNTTGDIPRFDLNICENGTASTDSSVTCSYSTTYYFQIERVDNGGANSTGQLTVRITTVNYYDETGAVAFDTLTLDCGVGEQNNFQYVYATASRGGVTNAITDGVVEDLNLAPLTFAWKRILTENDLHDPVTLGTANGLTLTTQELSLPTTATPQLAGLTIVKDDGIAILDTKSFGTTSSNQINTYNAHGSVASPEAVGIDDILLQIGCFGYNGTAFVGTRVKFSFSASQIWEVGKNGTQFNMSVTPNDTATRINALMVANNGYLGSGNFSRTSPPLEQIHSAAKVRADTGFNINGTDGISSTLTLDDGANWRITMTFTGGILTAKTTAASSGAVATWS